MKNNFNQINKEIILNHIVKNRSLRKNVLLMLVYKCCKIVTVAQIIPEKKEERKRPFRKKKT